MSTVTARVRESIAALIPGTRVHAARARYNTLAERQYALWEHLDAAGAAQRHLRALLLGDLAHLEHRLAAVYAIGWTTADDDQTIADATAVSASLLRLVASTEESTALGSRAAGEPAWESAFGHVLDALTDLTDLTTRAEVMTRLYVAAVPVVGDHAAETLARIGLAYTRAAVTDAVALQDLADNPGGVW